MSSINFFTGILMSAIVLSRDEKFMLSSKEFLNRSQFEYLFVIENFFYFIITFKLSERSTGM